MTIYRIFTGIACLLLSILLSSCAPSDTEPVRAFEFEGNPELLTTSAPTASITTDSPAATLLPVNPQGSIPTTTAQPTEAILELVRGDLARRLNADTSDIEVIHLEDRTWPDAGLGCVVRKGVFNEQPISGYRILLSYLGVTYEYHTSLEGAFRYCLDAGKPLDPIK